MTEIPSLEMTEIPSLEMTEVPSLEMTRSGTGELHAGPFFAEGLADEGEAE